MDLIVFSHEFSEKEFVLHPILCVEVTSSDRDEKVRESIDKLSMVISYLEELSPSARVSGVIVTPNFIRRI